jgi:hypothetical protein
MAYFFYIGECYKKKRYELLSASAYADVFSAADAASSASDDDDASVAVG